MPKSRKLKSNKVVLSINSQYSNEHHGKWNIAGLRREPQEWNKAFGEDSLQIHTQNKDWL